MPLFESVMIKIETEKDTAKTRDKAFEIADRMGFDRISCAEAALAVSEIAGNAVKFAGRGTAVIQLSSNKKSMKIVIKDNGPGIKDKKKVMNEGYSSLPASLGIGLNVAKRAMDEFSIRSKPGQGTKVFMKKYLQIPEEEIEYGILSLNDERYPVNGDAWLIKEFDGDKVLLSVIDGTGNGFNAHKIANFVKDIVEQNYKSDLTTIVRKCHKKMREEFDHSSVSSCVLGLLLVKPRSLEYLGVGDTSIDVMGTKQKINLLSRKGMVGDIQLPNLKLQRYRCGRKIIFIMCSDGISPRFTEDNFPLEQRAQKIANFIMENYRREYGDATILVAKRKM